MIKLTPIKTKKQAILKSIEIWTILYENPSFIKRDISSDLNYKYESGCPLCEYYKNSCHNCVLSDPNLCSMSQKGSAYNNWWKSTIKLIRKKYAGIILDALIKYKEEHYDKKEKTKCIL